MDLKDFLRRVEEEPELEWLGIDENDELGVRHVPTGIGQAVSLAAIENSDGDQLMGVLTMRRRPDVITKVARIVGYYSHIRNWNRSKLAELADRHRGDYTLDPDSVRLRGAAYVTCLRPLECVTAEMQPLRVYGSELCSRCEEVLAILEDRGIRVCKRNLLPEEMRRGAPFGVARFEAASVLAAFTLQDGELPAVLTWGFEAWIPQESIVAGDGEALREVGE